MISADAWLICAYGLAARRPRRRISLCPNTVPTFIGDTPHVLPSTLLESKSAGVRRRVGSQDTGFLVRPTASITRTSASMQAAEFGGENVRQNCTDTAQSIRKASPSPIVLRVR